MDLQVHLLPDLVPPNRLRGGVAVVIDVLRACTTAIQALASGCCAILPVAEVDQARRLADGMRAGKTLLAGERGGRPIDGFDLGNSPSEFTADVCGGTSVVMTTSNGTRAMVRAAEADRVLLAGFANFSAVCDQLLREGRPIHLICAGTDGEITIDDCVLAGALVEALVSERSGAVYRGRGTRTGEIGLNLSDSARLAWDCFEHHGIVIEEALRLSKGGIKLAALGYEADIRDAADIDRHFLVPELRRDPLRFEIAAVGVARSYWPHPTR